MYALKLTYGVGRKALLIIVKGQRKANFMSIPKQCMQRLSLYEGSQTGWANLLFCTSKISVSLTEIKL